MNHQKLYNLGVMYLEGDFLAINKTKKKSILKNLVSLDIAMHAKAWKTLNYCLKSN